MFTKKRDAASCLEVLFKLLDDAKLAPETMLKSEAQKERYESNLMFAFRKLQAARYHCQRVDELLELQRKELSQLASKPKKYGLQAESLTLRTNMSSDEFAFELCAFFAAIRSGVDFLSIACAQHIKEAQQTTSITTLLKLIKNERKGPILKVIAKNEEWLVQMRDYRDYLVHRLVIRTTRGGQIQWKHGKQVTTPYPIVVPSETPKNVPDTRCARAYDDPESRFDVATSEAFITDAHGKKRLIEWKVEIRPADGYIRVERLMKRELASFERFFVRIVEVLTESDFAPEPLKSSPKKPSYTLTESSKW